MVPAEEGRYFTLCSSEGEAFSGWPFKCLGFARLRLRAERGPFQVAQEREQMRGGALAAAATQRETLPLEAEGGLQGDGAHSPPVQELVLQLSRATLGRALEAPHGRLRSAARDCRRRQGFGEDGDGGSRLGLSNGGGRSVPRSCPTAAWPSPRKAKEEPGTRQSPPFAGDSPSSLAIVSSPPRLPTAAAPAHLPCLAALHNDARMLPGIPVPATPPSPSGCCMAAMVVPPEMPLASCQGSCPTLSRKRALRRGCSCVPDFLRSGLPKNSPQSCLG